tara:strand:- start:253 stop:477 length:225 start_codon:yes stop_codon:yes gene_type:complete
MENIDRHLIDNAMYNIDMAKTSRTEQTNERWTKEELALVDAKAKFHSMSRSEWIRTTSLNAEIKVTMPDVLIKF